ncbi:MAG: hypothetical protein ACTSW7_01010 [Candidatus Thorarchaeota archaeon]|nr:hypothetical protein [Thermoplasmatales archaeon]
MSKTEQTAIRISEELIARIDRYIENKQKEIPYKKLTRSDAIRMLLHQELELKEKDYVLELISSNEEALSEQLNKKAEELATESPNEPVIVPPNK